MMAKAVLLGVWETPAGRFATIKVSAQRIDLEVRHLPIGTLDLPGMCPEFEIDSDVLARVKQESEDTILRENESRAASRAHSRKFVDFDAFS